MAFKSSRGHEFLFEDGLISWSDPDGSWKSAPGNEAGKMQLPWVWFLPEEIREEGDQIIAGDLVLTYVGQPLIWTAQRSG